MNGKRIGMYLTSFNGGGAEREFIQLANEFAKRGAKIDLLVHKETGPLKQLISDNVNIILFNSHFIKDIFKLRSYIIKNAPEFLISTLVVPNIVISLAKIISFKSVKTSWRIVSPISYGMKSMSFFARLFIKLSVRLLSFSTSSVVCVSQGVKEDIGSYIPNEKKLITIYNPAFNINIESNSAIKPNHKFFNQLQKVIISAGRLKYPKDYITLLKAFKRVYKVDADCRLVILGEGPEKDLMMNFINENNLIDVVDLIGFTINPYPYIRYADVFVLSSNFEGFGNVIVEALALNTPVVSTDAPYGPREILEDGKWGSLVPVGDDKAMSEAILLILNGKKRLNTLDRAKEFSIENVVRKYVELIF